MAIRGLCWKITEIVMASQEVAVQAGVKTPFCGDLRSKKFYQLDRIATHADDYLDESNHCWCYHTQTPMGADGGYVTPQRCVPGRSCYRSAMTEPKKMSEPKK
jgi:hypothetical protein